MSTHAVATLHQQLRKSFRALADNQRAWNSVLAECAPLLGSLGNLAEQLRALDGVQIARTPLARFPDLRDRLRCKLLQAVDVVLAKLTEKTESLQTVRDAVHGLASAAFQWYEQNADLLDLATCTLRSAAAPSIAELLEWLQDADSYYRQQFLRRRNLLQMLRPDELSELESAANWWASIDSPDGDELISEMLFRVAVFVDSG
ncbi:AFG2-interacting ribosome maturation factor [Denticeps clupeoides]|uniref:Uncharacterized protein n=1 Tax=Denticeps clupeoides TaxID=299321 RepID=A0AAY4ERF4_9TELE|nr:uncharacterized protein C1orf109 homolog [Denticeps clupeoides]